MKNYPSRKSPRASFLDYNDGIYFITVCTMNMAHRFGEIRNNRMFLSPIGNRLDEELRKVGDHHANVMVPLYTIMPNHFHAIVRVTSPHDTDNAPSCYAPACFDRMSKPIRQKRLPALSLYVNHLKGAVTRYARQVGMKFEWQERYNDHAIRCVTDMNRISEYIKLNVIRWSMDCYHTHT